MMELVEMTATVVSWSGGKDSALMLAELGDLAGGGAHRPARLLTAFVQGADGERASAHGVRREWIERQAAALGLPLDAAVLPPAPSNDIYLAALDAALARAAAAGCRHVAFGDLFLADLKAWREETIAAGGSGLSPLFPLWGRPTGELARQVVARGFAAFLVAVDTEQLDPAFAGRPYDAALLADLPEGVDPCGENGEFHTFVWNGPGFAFPLACRPGALRRDGRFVYREIEPA
jgi:uncharacterized protein (TIGR00290 family)